MGAYARGVETVAVAGVPRAGRRRRWARRHPLAVDAGMSVLLMAALLYGSVAEADPNHKSEIPAGVTLPHVPGGAYVLVAVASLVLTWRRRRPLIVLAVSVLAVAIYTCLGFVDGAALVAPAVALYAVAVAIDTRRAVVLTLITMVGLMVANAAFDPLGTTGGGFVLIPGEYAAALFLGIAVKNRRAYIAAVEDRAVQAERSREEEARRRVDAERLRIARELHDVVAHTMALINVQAGVAAHVAAQQPEQAVAALTAIKSASKEGLRELRAILTVLRQADEGEPTTPAPRLAQLDELVSAARGAGLDVTVQIVGGPRPLSAGVDLTAYRIVQESLTNVVRHAPGAATTVTIAYDVDALRVDVVDSGGDVLRAESGDGAGHGVAGMRERAAALGGSLRVGRDSAGGFEVSAVLPLEAP